MNLAFFIARRTAQRTPENKPGVMERIAVISVALSVAVMLLAMAVIMGFKQEVSRKVAAFSGHAVVNGVRGVGTLDSAPVRRSARAEEPDPHHRRIRVAGPLCRQGRYRTHGGCRAGGDAQGRGRGLRLVVVRSVAGGGRACPVWAIRCVRRIYCCRAAWPKN